MSRLPGRPDPDDVALGCLFLIACGFFATCTLRGLYDVVMWVIQ